MSCHPGTGNSIVFEIKFSDIKAPYFIRVRFGNEKYDNFLKAFGQRVSDTLQGKTLREMTEILLGEYKEDDPIHLFLGILKPQEHEEIFQIDGTL